MDNVLMGTEIDLYVESMKPTTLSNIGSRQWLEWHHRLQKLNQQALIEVAAVSDQHIKETLISFNKTSILIHEAILINVWKHKILPLLLQMQPQPANTFMAYTILYHEAVCVALLELVMYHADCAETLEDAAIDLLDYVCGTISQLLSVKQREGNPEEAANEELIRQRDNLTFDIGIRSLTILRYIAEYIDKLPLAVGNRMFCFHDVPVLLAQLLIEKPWRKDRKVYSGGRWVERSDEAVAQPEGQVWLALHQLLLHQSCATHYELTASRRAQLAKLHPLLIPPLIDQLSVLIELQYWLCKATMSECPFPPSQKPVLLISMLEIKEKILKEGEGRWKKIAKEQLPVIFCTDHKTLMETAQCLSEAYNADLLEKFEAKEKHECAQCGKDSIQRCSRCKKVWYCSRKCQITHWSEHQELCLHQMC